MTNTKGCIASVYHLTDDHTPDFYIVKKCPHTRVTTILENEVEEWHALTPVVIDAPVGLGKSTFVREVLYPRARSHGKNIVVVNNRSALTAQQKKDFLKQVQSEYLRILSEKGIAEQKIFDDIAIVTYQGLVSFLNDPANKEWINQVEYVIADELHFFASDASFNYNCDLILRTLIRAFSKAVRVYMTATPWDMLYPLSKAEETFYSNISEGHFCIANHVFRPPRRGILYHFERDFSDYSLRFFEKTEEIIEKILADKKEKWLIFIDRKDRLLDISSGLSDKPNYLDADQKETPIFEKLVQEERFDGQVLISTSVIDCGINIVDENLKNIVIFSDDRTALMQMAGRKRLRDGDTITLWIHTPSEKALTKQKNRYNVFLDFEEEYTNRLEQLELAPKRPYQAFHDLIIKIWNHPCIELRNLFQVTGNRVHKNELAFFKMHRKVDFYNNILSGKTTFQREVEDWFGKPHTDCNTALNALDLFYENHFKQFLDSKEQDALRELVILAYKETGKTQARTDRNDTIGAIALNNLLVEINSQYRVERINSQFWGLFKNN